MILDKRQTKFGAVQVPEINRWETKIELSNYLEYIKNSLVRALIKRFDGFNEGYENNRIEDCVSQSLNFLMILGAIKENQDTRKEVIDILKGKELELWKEFIQLTPIYEGINIQLKTMLIKYHYPFMYSEIHKGKVYSHFGLTIISECVLYTLEFLQKENLLKDEIELLERENVKNWLNPRYHLINSLKD